MRQTIRFIPPKDSGMTMTDEIHSCSYQCDRPACIRAQRVELRAEVERMRQRAEQVEYQRDNLRTVAEAEKRGRLALQAKLDEVMQEYRPDELARLRTLIEDAPVRTVMGAQWDDVFARYGNVVWCDELPDGTRVRLVLDAAIGAGK